MELTPQKNKLLGSPLAYKIGGGVFFAWRGEDARSSQPLAGGRLPEQLDGGAGTASATDFSTSVVAWPQSYINLSENQSIRSGCIFTAGGVTIMFQDRQAQKAYEECSQRA